MLKVPCIHHGDTESREVNFYLPQITQIYADKIKIRKDLPSLRIQIDYEFSGNLSLSVRSRTSGKKDTLSEFIGVTSAHIGGEKRFQVI